MVANLQERKDRKVGVLKTLSSLVERAVIATRAGLRFGGLRDYNEVFGYEKDPTWEHFLGKYDRQAIAGRIVDAPPEATWSDPPTIEQAPARVKSKWDELTSELPIWTTLHRADRLARLGYYSVVLIGLDDGAPLEAPASPRASAKITFLKPLPYNQAPIEKFVGDPTDPRYGKPEIYKVKFEDPRMKRILGGSSSTGALTDRLVHWSRMVHIVENPLEDELVSQPIIGKVFNLLDDLMKVTGGAPEIFWLNARGGMQVDVDKEMSLDDSDLEQLSDEIDEYMHQLRRIIRTRGVEINDLTSTVADPSGVFNMIMSLLSGATGIPKRILLGSEAGQLASEQDRANWAERIEDRRVLHAEPYILKPFVGHLQYLKILNAGVVKWSWPEAFRMSPKELSETASANARAVASLSKQLGKQPMQITTEEEARGFLGLEGKIPDSERVKIEPLTPPSAPNQRIPPSATEE